MPILIDPERLALKMRGPQCCRLKSAMGPLVVVVILVVVSVTGLFLRGGIVSPTPNPDDQVLGFHLIPPLRSARLV